MIKIKNNFDLEATITCGQIFRFKKINNKYIVILKDRVISLEEDSDEIIIKSNKEDNLKEVIYDYFDLDRDYNKIEKDILKLDKRIKDTLVFNRGLKMIHQDPFETILEYVISQNNRVTSIANSLDLIALNYGEKVIFENETYYLLPDYKKIKELKIEDYRNCKVGFRDKYLYEIISKINNNELDINKIYDMGSEDALKYLMSFKGIGNKVASCILLFAYQKFDVYPIDTWVKKYMLDEYNIDSELKIKEYTKKTYKEYSGIVIQYMFNYKRNKN